MQLAMFIDQLKKIIRVLHKRLMIIVLRK